MEAVLSILAVVAAVASSLAAVLCAVASKGFTIRTPSGPDAMGIVVFFVFSLLGWIVTLVGAMLAACRGGFDWFVRPPAVACMLLIPVVAGLTFVSFIAMAASLENKFRLRTLWGWLGALLLPVASNALVGFVAVADRESLAGSSVMRWMGLPLGLVAAAAVIAGIGMWVHAQGKKAHRIADYARREDEQREQNRKEQLERDAQHKAELEAMPDDAPLATFVTHLFIDKSEEHHKLALARIAGLPDLAARFDRELMDPDPLAREYLLNYFVMAPAVDPALAAALTPVIARCFEHLGEDLVWLAEDPGHRAHRHARGMTLGLLKAAERFPARFAGPARGLRRAFEAWPNETVRAGAQELLDRYLTSRPLGD